MAVGRREVLPGRRAIASPTRVAVAIWVAVFVSYVAIKGFPYTTDDVLIWLFALLVACSLADLRRSGPRALRDWVPLFGVLVVYNHLRGYATTTHWVAHYGPQLAVDRVLGAGQILSVLLQQWLWHPSHPAPWDYAIVYVYLSHFVTSFIVAAVLWRRNYERFCRYMWMYLVLTFTGFVVFVLWPSQPPWMVAEHGHVPALSRVVVVMLGRVKLHLAAAIILKGSAYANPVAAMPSLHAAYPLLITLTFWRTSRWWARAILVAYPTAMAFTLVYGAEHFVVDVVVGWLFAVAVHASLSPAFDWWQSAERRQPQLVTAPG